MAHIFPGLVLLSGSGSARMGLLLASGHISDEEHKVWEEKKQFSALEGPPGSWAPAGDPKCVPHAARLCGMQKHFCKTSKPSQLYSLCLVTQTAHSGGAPSNHTFVQTAIMNTSGCHSCCCPLPSPFLLTPNSFSSGPPFLFKVEIRGYFV